MNILITGSGAPGSRGTYFCLKSIGEINKVIGIDADINKRSISNAIFGNFVLAPKTSDDDYVSKILKICVKENISLIVPQTTREIETLSLHKEFFLSNGIKIGVSNHDAIMNSNDKLFVTKKLNDLGYGDVRIIEVTNKDELIKACKKFNYPDSPVVIKAKNLNGKRGYRVIQQSSFNYQSFIEEKPQSDGIDLETILKTFPENFEKLMVMEYFPGEEFSVDAFIGRETEIAIPRERTSIRSGISFSNKLVKDDYLINATLQYGRSAGLNGVFGMQFKRDKDGKFQVLECNPRIQGTMVVAALSGANIIGMYVNELLNENFIHEYNINWETVFHRYWGGYGFNEQEILEI